MSLFFSSSSSTSASFSYNAKSETGLDRNKTFLISVYLIKSFSSSSLVITMVMQCPCEIAFFMTLKVLTVSSVSSPRQIITTLGSSVSIMSKSADLAASHLMVIYPLSCSKCSQISFAIFLFLPVTNTFNFIGSPFAGGFFGGILVFYLAYNSSYL